MNRGPPPGSFLRPDGNILPPGEHPVTLALRTGERQSDVELGMRRPDGTLVWLSVHAQPVRLPDGKVGGAVVSYFDVTQRRQALQRSEGQLRTIADSVPDAGGKARRTERIVDVAHGEREPLGRGSPAVGAFSCT
jgi:PAS domain-containing protein